MMKLLNLQKYFNGKYIDEYFIFENLNNLLLDSDRPIN